MDPLTGGLVAAGVAWLSILLVILLPGTRRRPDPRHVRWLGGSTIALLALQVLGLAMPVWLPVAVFLGGLLLIVVIAPEPPAAAA